MADNHVVVFDDIERISGFVITKWTEISKEAIRENGRFVVALSGGRTPVRVYQKLAEKCKGLPWEKTHIFLADERYVSSKNAESNYRMIKENLLDSIDIPVENIHPVDIGRTASDSADMYEKDIIEFFSLEKGVFPVFDLVMLGVGEDGHTASLFPGDTAVDEKERLIAQANVIKYPHGRITLTIPVISKAGNIIFLVTGKTKSKAVKDILEGDSPLPPSLVMQKNKHVLFLLDKKAASDLERQTNEVQ